MAEIKASDVGKLRETTGAGLMDCKKALVEANGVIVDVIAVDQTFADDHVDHRQRQRAIQALAQAVINGDVRPIDGDLVTTPGPRLAEALAALDRAVIEASEAETTLEQALDGAPTVLVLGSEGEGMRRLVREHCELMARIPLPGGFESLNVSTAAAIALYEAARTRPGAKQG